MHSEKCYDVTKVYLCWNGIFGGLSLDQSRDRESGLQLTLSYWGMRKKEKEEKTVSRRINKMRWDWKRKWSSLFSGRKNVIEAWTGVRMKKNLTISASSCSVWIIKVEKIREKEAARNWGIKKKTSGFLKTY